MEKQKESREKPRIFLNLQQSLSFNRQNQGQSIQDHQQQNSVHTVNTSFLTNASQINSNPPDESSQKNVFATKSSIYLSQQQQQIKQIPDWTLDGMLEEQSLVEALPLQKPLTLNRTVFKSISTFSYKMLFGYIIQFSNFRIISSTQKTYDPFASICNILHIFQHTLESGLEQVSLKAPAYNRIFSVIGGVRFPSLKSLHLNYCEITSVEPLTWMDLPSLADLRLEWNLITSVDCLSNMKFEKTRFLTLLLNNNIIKSYAKFSRINIQRLYVCRTDNIPTDLEPTQNECESMRLSNVQSEDVSFLFKQQAQIQCLRIRNKRRIKQQKILDCVYRMDSMMFLEN